TWDAHIRCLADGYQPRLPGHAAAAGRWDERGLEIQSHLLPQRRTSRPMERRGQHQRDGMKAYMNEPKHTHCKNSRPLGETKAYEKNYETQTQTVSSWDLLRGDAGNWLILQSGRSGGGFG